MVEGLGSPAGEFGVYLALRIHDRIHMRNEHRKSFSPCIAGLWSLVTVASSQQECSLSAWDQEDSEHSSCYIYTVNHPAAYLAGPSRQSTLKPSKKEIQIDSKIITSSSSWASKINEGIMSLPGEFTGTYIPLFELSNVSECHINV